MRGGRETKLRPVTYRSPEQLELTEADTPPGAGSGSGARDYLVLNSEWPNGGPGTAEILQQ
jgi:hypothetical protein